MKVKSESEVTQSCPIPSDPMDCSLPDSSIHGIFQATVLEWVAIAFSALDIERGLKLVTDLIFKPVTLKGMRKDTLGRGSIGKSTCSF